MFTENKYTKWYYQIINNAKNRLVEGYTENHHVIPKSLGGSNDPDNLIKLTAREHFICHLLLTKMIDGHQKHKMLRAYKCMVEWQNENRFYKVNSKLYESLKKQCVPWNKGKKGVQIVSEETRKKISESHKGKVKPEGFAENLRKLNTGKTHTEETKKKLSELGKQQYLECRTGLKDFTGHKHSEERKQLISQKSKNYWEKVRLGLIERKKYKMTPEQIAKRSKSRSKKVDIV